MAFQPVPNTAELRLFYTQQAAEFVSTFYVRQTAVAWNATLLDQAADAVASWWDTELQPLQSDNLHAVEVVARDITTEFGATATTVINLDGGRTSQALPPLCAALIQWRGDAGSPPRRGFTFSPGLTEDQTLANNIDTTTRNALAAAYAALNTALVAANVTFAQVLVSRYSGFTLVDFPDGTKRKVPTKRNPALTNTLDTVSCREVVGAQRDRRTGEGS